MLDYKLVEALALVVREGGFDKAAKALHLTQSAVSQRVKLLEEQAGQVLLIRSTPPQATASGLELLKHYRKVERLEGDLAMILQEDRLQEANRLPVGVNADSLATWFLDAVQPFLLERGVLLDLRVDDQEQTHTLLRRGEVVGCVSAREQAVQGCRSHLLGHMVYRLVATPAFQNRWFKDGFILAAVEQAPAVIFDRKDGMHTKVLESAFGTAQRSIPIHYIPSSEKFVEAMVGGLGYGMVPEVQARAYLRQGQLIEMAPEHAVSVALYWHCWNIGSPLLEEFSSALVERAGMALKR